MKRFRVSVAGLMAGIVYLGFAFAALARPSVPWAEAWMTATMTILAVATLGALYSPEGKRPFRGGFALVGWGVMVLSVFPDQAPRLMIHAPLEAYYHTLSYDPGPAEASVWASMGRGYQEVDLSGTMPGDPKGRYQVMYNIPNVPGSVTAMIPSANLKPLGPDDFQRLCHAILAPLLGLAGGLVARSFAGRTP